MNSFKRKNVDQFLSYDKTKYMRIGHWQIKERCVELILFIIILLVTFMSFAL